MGTVNWAALAKEAGDISPVPIGKYLAIITKAELKLSAAQNEYWQAIFRVQEGPQAGRLLYNNFTLTESNPNALRAFFINMGNLGISQDQLVALGPDKNALTPIMVGRQALLTVSHREYQGQMRENIDRVEKHPAGPVGNLSAAAAGGGGGSPVPGGGGTPMTGWAPTPTPSAPVVAFTPQPQAAPIAAPPVQAAPVVPPAPPVVSAAPPALPTPPAAPLPPVAPVANVASVAPVTVQEAVPTDQAAQFAAFLAAQAAQAAPAPAVDVPGVLDQSIAPAVAVPTPAAASASAPPAPPAPPF